MNQFSEVCCCSTTMWPTCVTIFFVFSPELTTEKHSDLTIISRGQHRKFHPHRSDLQTSTSLHENSPDLMPESSSWWKCVCLSKSVSSGELHKVLVREWMRNTPSLAELSLLRFIGIVTQNKRRQTKSTKEEIWSQPAVEKPVQLICACESAQIFTNRLSIRASYKSRKI